MVLCPPGARWWTLALRLGDFRDAFASGWMRCVARAGASGDTTGFVLVTCRLAWPDGRHCGDRCPARWSPMFGSVPVIVRLQRSLQAGARRPGTAGSGAGRLWRDLPPP